MRVITPIQVTFDWQQSFCENEVPVLNELLKAVREVQAKYPSEIHLQYCVDLADGNVFVAGGDVEAEEKPANVAPIKAKG